MLTCGGGGLRDILIDSDVYVYASVDQVLSGKQYTPWCPSLSGVNRKPILYVENFGINSLMCNFLWGG